MTRITLDIPDSLRASLDDLGRQSHRSAEQVARELIEKAMVLERLRQLRQELRPYAEAAGFLDDEDVFKAVS